jgi:hypothetical protein
MNARSSRQNRAPQLAASFFLVPREPRSGVSGLSVLRTSDGLHRLRHRRRGCATELDGPAGTAEPDRRALAMRGKSYDRPC